MSEHEPHRDPVQELFSRGRAEVSSLPAGDAHWQAVVATARAHRRAARLRYAAAAAVVVLLGGGALLLGTGHRPGATAPATQGTGAATVPAPVTTAVPEPTTPAPPTSAPATAVGWGDPVPHDFTALSMSNAGHGALFVLGFGQCGGPGERCPLLVGSADDGGTWRVLHAFPDNAFPAQNSLVEAIQPGSVLSQVRFADAQVGWVFGGGAMVTRDGGRTWRQVTRAGESVVDLATDGQVAYLVSGRSCAPGTCSGTLTLASQRVGGTGSEPTVLGARALGLWSDATVAIVDGRPVVGVQADTALALRPGGGATLREGTPVEACHSGEPPFLTADAATQRTLVGLCGTQGTAGSLGYAVATSSDGAAWRVSSTEGLLLVDAGNITLAAADTANLLAASGGSPDVHGEMKVSHDGGRTWVVPAGAPPLPQRGWRWVGAPGGSQYYALSGDGPQYWVSDDLGDHWEKVTIG